MVETKGRSGRDKRPDVCAEALWNHDDPWLRPRGGDQTPLKTLENRRGTKPTVPRHQHQRRTRFSGSAAPGVGPRLG